MEVSPSFNGASTNGNGLLLKVGAVCPLGSTKIVVSEKVEAGTKNMLPTTKNKHRVTIILFILFLIKLIDQ